MSRVLVLLAAVAVVLGVVGFFGLAGDLSAGARVLFYVLATAVVMAVLLGRARRS